MIRSVRKVNLKKKCVCVGIFLFMWFMYNLFKNCDIYVYINMYMVCLYECFVI